MRQERVLWKAGRKRPRKWIGMMFLVGAVLMSPHHQYCSRAQEIMDDEQNNQNADESLLQHVLPKVQEALTGASLSRHADQQPAAESTVRRRKRDRLRALWDTIQQISSTAYSSSGVATVAESQSLAWTANLAAQVEHEIIHDRGGYKMSLTSGSSEDERRKERRRDRIRQQRARYEASRRRAEQEDPVLDTETIEGARLLSVSFGVIANTIGLIADGVRVSGETAAGAMGSSVKLVGTAVKSVSSNIDAASRILEPKQKIDGKNASEKGRKQLTAERLKERQQKREHAGTHGEDEEVIHHDNVFRNTRSVAAQSLRLVGSVVRGFGDSLVLAGSATESIAASAAGVAEGSVRIFEDFAGSVSVAMTAATGRSSKRQNELSASRDQAMDDDSESEAEDLDEDGMSYLSFGAYDYPTEFESIADWVTRMERRRSEEDNATLRSLLVHLSSRCLDFVAFLFAETRGVPSFSYDLLGVMILCYLAALWTLSPRKRRAAHAARNDIPMLAVEEEDSTSSQSAADPADRHNEQDHDDDLPMVAEGTPVAAQKTGWSRILLFPFRFVLSVALAMIRLVFSRSFLLVNIYLFAWLYLSRASQLRSATIQRHGEASGFRAAIDSLGQTTPTAGESVIWLNSLLEQLWRVTYNPLSEKDRNWARGARDYPEFVRRAIRDSMEVKPECLWEGADSPACNPYGGLEPYIVSKIGGYLLDIFEESKVSRSSDVAYVSLYSFTLGSRPPLVRSVELLGKRGDGKYLHFDIDVDAFLEDLSLVLEVKLSSLDYSLLPSTKVSIHAIDVKLPLRVSVSATPDYPFVSSLEFSLAKAPDCNVRITPMSRDSGLKGVDLGSLPVIREWVQEVIRETLSEYVTPKYIELDFASWMKSGTKCDQRTEIPPITDLSQLRQKTRAPVSPNPRTSSSRGVEMASIADTLASHRSASNSLAVHHQDDRHLGAHVRPIIKPTNELSRLGMDRWMSKQEDAVKSSDEEPTKGRLEVLRRLISPFLFAMAAGIFRDRVVDDRPSDERVEDDKDKETEESNSTEQS